MERNELKAKYDKAVVEYVKSSGWDALDDVMYGVYSIMWSSAPNKVVMYCYESYMKEHFTTLSHLSECVNGEDEEDEKYDNIVEENTFINIIAALDSRNIVYDIIRYEAYPIIITETKDIIFMYANLVVLTQEDKLPDYIAESLVFADEDESTYHYLIYDKDGFTTMPLQIAPVEMDITLNYNDDLPDKQIREFLCSDDSGLIILRGKPGSGKTSYIRNLITSVDRDFLYLDQSAFDNITDATFIRTLDDYENAVLILEDCEALVSGANRLEGNNKLSALLNLTDGLIGDSFKFKVICTFNANIGKIDAALLRKGRLKVDYEFKELNEDKVQKLAAALGKKRENKKMLLTDVYNDKDDIVTSSDKAMGFL